MTQPTTQEMVLLEERGLLFLLASVVTSYLDGHGRDCVRNLLEDARLDSAGSRSSQHWPLLLKHLKRIAQDEPYTESIQTEYISIFEHSKELNPLYETEFGRDRSVVKGAALADVAGFYHAFGLLQSHDSITHEMPDHIAVELEFYSYMLFKEIVILGLGDNQGIDIVRSGRQKFLSDHLGRFASAIKTRPGVAASEYFSIVFSWCADLISKECALMDAAPIQVEFFGEASGYEGISCGGAKGAEQVL